MSELIKSKEDLISYLTSKQICSKTPPKSVYVSSSVRRKILTDEMQGKFIYKGTSKRFAFKSVGGGVYEASIESTRKPKGPRNSTL